VTVYLPDTHAIYWNEFDDPKLSPTVKRAFIDAEQGRAAMVIHPIVIAELI
jgi:PIN domain nuclease of toxin-antitoxin system